MRPVGGKPVLLIYGDTHRFTIEKPMAYPLKGFNIVTGANLTSYSPVFTGGIIGTTLTVTSINSTPTTATPNKIMIGMGLTGAGIVGTCTVIQQLSIDPAETRGAGYRGTYSVSTSQTASGTITGITQNWDQFFSWDMPNYTEIQVPGAPRVGWMKINVNTLDPKLFSFQYGPIPRSS
jgi:hypothetical protein